ncbi:uncharacterized protein [Maniola hyperantus]|uniref:uncharacterized protein n=1 Tax=Aphantopus hyperantus TaxID=2795564 RepID=UPI00213F7329
MSDKMYRFAVFLVGVVVWVKTDHVDVRLCVETAALNGGCCQYNMTEEKIEMLKECPDSSNRDPKNCDFETCYGLKAGFLLSNGSIDKTAYEAMIEKDYEYNADLKDLLKEKCLVDDLSFYGLPQMCEVKKFGSCLSVYYLLKCPQWHDSEHCNEVQNIVKECESVYP